MLVRICDACEERFEEDGKWYGIEIIEVEAYLDTGRAGTSGCIHIKEDSTKLRDVP